MDLHDAYRECFLRSRFPLPTEEEVQNLEKKLAIALPESYRSFLLGFNGGYFHKLDIRVESHDYKDRLDVLDGIVSTHPSVELGRTSSINILDDNDPVIILPIGYTTRGFLLLTFVDFEEERGEIYGKRPSSDEYIFLGEDIISFFRDSVFPSAS